MSHIRYIVAHLCLVGVLSQLFLPFVYAEDTQEDFNAAKTQINAIQVTNPILPNGVTEQRGRVGEILKRLFDAQGRIGNWYIKALRNVENNAVMRWSGGKDGFFLTGSIYDTGTNVGIGESTPNFSLDISGDINFTGDLRKNGIIYNPTGKFKDGTPTSVDAVYTDGGNVGIGLANPSEALTVVGRISVTGDPNSDDDVGDRAYNDARYLNTTEKAADADLLDGLDSTAFVRTTTNQTIAGVKTFSSTIAGSINGNSATATALETARTIGFSGVISGSASFDGTSNITIATTLADNSITSAKILDGEVASADIADGTIVNADINASAAIAGTKISPNFGSQTIVTTGNANLRSLNFTNLEPTNLVSDGNVGFDSSRGLIIYRTQQVGQEAGNGTYTVLDTSNITGGNNITITNTAGGISGTEAITFNVNDGPGSGLDADTLDGIDSAAFVQTSGNQTVAGVKTFSSTIVGDVSGNAGTATTLETARNIAVTGDISGSTSFDGSANVSINSTIGNAVVTGTKISADTITAANIAADAVGASELADNSVASANIINATIIGADIASNTITAANIAADAVGASELANNSVASANIINGSVASLDITDNTIAAIDIAPDAVGASELADNSVASANIINGSVTSADITDSTITDTDIAADTITAANIAADAVGASELANNSVASANIINGSVVSADIATDTITAANIAANAVGASELAGNAVRTAHILNGTIVNADINNAAAIAGTKISPNFGTQDITTSGALNLQNLIIGQYDGDTGVGPDIYMDDSGLLGADRSVYINLDVNNDETDRVFAINKDSLNITTAARVFTVHENGNVDITGMLSVSGGINGDDITDGTIDSSEIQDGSITTDDILDGTILAIDISADTITAGNIAADAIGASELANNSVASANIINGSVTSTDITDNTIAAIDIAPDAVGASELANNSVASANIINATIIGADIAASTITGANIAADTITAANIAADAIGASELADNSVASANIINGSVTSADIANATITNTDIASDTIVAGNIAANAVGASELDNSGNFTVGSISATDNVAFSWENGVNNITNNDGGGNVQIRFGHDDSASAERFTHAGTAFYVGGDLDSSNGKLQLRVASNGGAGDNQAITWGPTLAIGASTLTWNGSDVLTSASNVDADTLDGYDSTDFVNVFGDQTVGGIKTFTGTIVGDISGNAGTATALQTARNIALSGHLSGSASFNGTSNITIASTISNGVVNSAKITDNSIAAVDIAPDAVGASELANNAVASANIIDGSVTSADIANDTITEADISNAFVARDSNLLDGIDSTGYVQTSGNQTIGGIKTFTSPIRVVDTFDVDGSGPNAQSTGLYLAQFDGTVGTTNNPTYTSAIVGQINGNRSIALSVDSSGYLWGYRTHGNAGTYTFQSKSKWADDSGLLDGIDSTGFIQVGTSGDQIQNGTIDSSEIENNTIASGDILNDTITEADISDAFVARDSNLLDGIDSTSFIRADANDDVTGHTEWQDNYEARFGTSADLRISHNGTNSFITNYTGEFYIRNNSNGDRFIFQSTDAGGTNRNVIIADPDNYVDLYYAGSRKLRTLNTGVEITGTVIADDPTAANHLATKNYVDTLVTQGVTWKAPVETGNTIVGTWGACDASKQSWTTYNKNDDIIYICDGSAWLSIGSSASIPYATTTTAGKVQIAGDIQGTWNNITLKNGVVDSAAIANNTITAADIASGGVGTVEIAGDAVTSAKILNATILGADIATDTITATNIAADAVGASELANNAVASANIVNGSIVNADVNNSAAIAGTKISPDFGSQNITTTGNVNLRSTYFGNIEPTNLTADGNVGFDSSRGLIIYRTQQVGQETGNGGYTVLDTSNITGGSGINITNTAAGISGTEAITFSVDDGPGSGLDADTLDGIDSTGFVQTTGDQAISGIKTFNGTLQSFYDNNVQGTNVKLGRSTSQYVTFHGGAGGNYITSVSTSGNPKNLIIRANQGTTDQNFVFNSTNGSLTAASFIGNGASITNINGDNITNGTIDGSEIQDNTLAAADIAANAIGASELADNSVASANIINGSVSSADITNNTITETDISDAFVARDSQLLDGIDSTAFLRSDTSDTMNGLLTISNASVVSGSSTPSHIELYAPNSGDPTNEVSMRFHQGSQYYSQIRMRTGGFRFTQGNSDVLVPITASLITGSSFVGDGAGITNIAGDNIQNGTIDGTEIQDNSLAAADLAADSVGASELANNAVASANIINGTIASADIAANAVGNTELDNSADFTVRTLTATDGFGLAWENGVNRITNNDGGGNVQIRFGHDFTSSAERFTHAGTAYYIGGAMDNANGALQLKVASNGGAGNDQAVTWGSTLSISDTALTWDGSDVLTTASNIDADTLDSLNSTQFLRSDVADTKTSKLTINSGTYGDHLELVRSAETWQISPSTDGSLNFTHPSGGAQNRIEVPGIESAARMTVGGTNVMLWGDSGDNIQNGTIDGTEIQDNSLTASDLAANSVGNSELIDDPTVSSLTVGSSLYSSYSGTPISSLVNGTTGGGLIEAPGSSHIVVGIRGNDVNDSFSIVSGGGNYQTDSTYDTLVANFDANGNVSLGGNLTLGGTLNGDSITNGTIDSSEIQDNTIASGDILNNTITENDISDAFVARDSNLLDGYNSSEASTASTVAVRNGNGDINARLFRSEYDSTNGNIGFIMTQVDTASNNYIRPSTPAQFRAAVTDGSYLAIGAQASDSNLLDGLDSTAFLRSNADDSYDNGTLTIRSNSASGNYWGNGIEYISGWKHTNDNSYGYLFRNAGAAGMQVYIAKEAGTTGSVATTEVYTFGSNGTFSAPSFSGNGSSITSIAGDNITNGTIDSSEIQNNTLTASDLAANSVGESEIADGAVRTAEILNGTIVNADVSASAAISGTKINPNFGTQNIYGGLGIFNPGNTYPYIQLGAQSNDKIYADNSAGDSFGGGIWFRVANDDNSASLDAMRIKEDGRIQITYDPIIGDDVGNRDYNDARYINVGESGDSIANGTIDSTEIENDTLTASDIAANAIGDSELNNAASFTMAGLTSNGGTTVDVSAGGDFLVKDTSKGTVDNVIWYDRSAGRVFLGNTGAAGIEVQARGNFDVTGVISGNGSSITSINGDNITNGTIDSTEIQNDTLTAADLAANSVGNSELIDDPTFANLSFTSANGNGPRFWGSDMYKIYMSNTGDATWGGNLDGTSDYNMYFRMGGGTNRGFVFRNNATNVAQFDANGNLYLGQADTGGQKTMYIRGGATNEGGEIRLETAANSDTSYDYYFMDAYTDDFRLGRAGVGTDFLLLQNGTIQIGNKLDMTDGDIVNARQIQLQDLDDDTGGSDNKYRLLARDGAWQFYNGGVVVGNYGNGTWTDVPDGNLIVESRIGIGTTPSGTLASNNSLAIGDSDTGFKLLANGNLGLYTNNSESVRVEGLALQVGYGEGSMAMTLNDGQGNANLTFNHRNGVPDQTGNSGRIAVNVDGTTNANMSFQLVSGVTGGTSVSTTNVLQLFDDGDMQLGGSSRMIDNVTCIGNCF